MIPRTALPSLAVCLLALGSFPALAEQHTVKMKNRGDDGTMVFEPGYPEAQPGDTRRASMCINAFLTLR